MDSPPPSKGIIFDFDGTLYGDWRLWISLIEETLREFNLSVTAYEALELARNEIRTGEAKETIKISGIAVSLAREQGLERDDEVRSRFFEKLDAKMDETGPGDDLVRLLEQLQRKGFIMGLVTFVRKTRLTRRLDTWKLRDYFRSAITPDQVAEFKPSPEPYLKAIEDLHLAPKECIVVGDEPVDMLGGKRAGTRTIGLPQGFYSREELEEAGADTIITSLNALPSVLFK
jgi:HAD superfamily hydrolase (TIGR01509 family)